jgi:cytochrome c553
MKDFKSGARPASIMKRYASGYTDAEFVAMGDYFASLKK